MKRKKMVTKNRSKIELIIVALIFLFTFTNCKNADNEPIKIESKSDCKLNKLDLLLKNIFRKHQLYPLLQPLEYNDSVKYFYLITENFEVTNKNDFYITFEPDFNSNRLDSTKLIPSEKERILNNYNSVILKIIECNKDTSEVKISVELVQRRISRIEANFSYQFYPDSCSWIIKDSTLWMY